MIVAKERNIVSKEPNIVSHESYTGGRPQSATPATQRPHSAALNKNKYDSISGTRELYLGQHRASSLLDLSGKRAQVRG